MDQDEFQTHAVAHHPQHKSLLNITVQTGKITVQTGKITAQTRFVQLFWRYVQLFWWLVQLFWWFAQLYCAKICAVGGGPWMGRQTNLNK